MASGPITSRQIDGEIVETVREFSFLSSKITADGDCSHEIKRHLLLGRKAMTNLDSMLKSGDITLPTKVLLVKAIVFPVVMCGCERSLRLAKRKKNNQLFDLLLSVRLSKKLGLVCAYMLSCAQFCVTLWSVTCQAPLSMGFSRQEY